MAEPEDGRLSGFGVVSRRRFVGWGLAGAGLFLGGGTSGLLTLRGSAPVVPGLRCLSAHEHRTMRALASTIVPSGGPFAAGADDFDLAGAFDAFLADEPGGNVRDLKAALLLVELGPLVFERRLVTFSNLDPAGRRAHWDGWEAGSELRRKVAVAFRKFTLLVFYDRPEAWAGVGYDGAWLRAVAR